MKKLSNDIVIKISKKQVIKYNFAVMCSPIWLLKIFKTEGD